MTRANTEFFDFIIVGAGSAGSVLANKLSANGLYTVLVLEQGPKDKALCYQCLKGLVLFLKVRLMLAAIH